MTDKTDISPLISSAISLTEKVMAARGVAELDRAAVAASGFAAKGLLTDLVKLLEAERQRGDYGQQVITQRNAECDRLINELAALKSEINWPVAQKVRAALDRVACPDAFMRVAVEACTETLKGYQVPMEYQTRTKPNWDDRCPWSDWEKCSEGTYNDLIRANLEICDWIHEVRKLFTAQQKPVVLPKLRKLPDLYMATYHESKGFNEGVKASKAAIEAAGGIVVKDGE